MYDAFDDLNWSQLLSAALKEDRASADVTTKICKSFLDENTSSSEDKNSTISFSLISREEGVFCGAKLFEHLAIHSNWEISFSLNDGDSLQMGTVILEAQAPWHSLLSQERSVLNIIQHLSGIATQTHQFQKKINEAYELWSDSEKEVFPKPELYHTRKTLPGLRPYQVYAACVGGSQRHRLHLADRVMLKDNHKFLLQKYGKSFVDLVDWARAWGDRHWDLWLVEVDNPPEALHMAAVGVQHLLLDNFSPDRVRQILPALSKVKSVEISGGLKLETIKDFVIPGVHRMSVGALTHGARSLDISLEFAS